MFGGENRLRICLLPSAALG